MKKHFLSTTILFFLIPSVVAADKKSWTEQNTRAFVDGCIKGVLDPARRDYYARAEQVGNSNPKPFPEEQVISSIEPLCTCVAAKIREGNISFERALQNEPKVAKISQDAVVSGACRMGGDLGKALSEKMHPSDE